MYDKNSGEKKIATHLEHIFRCKTTAGTNWSNRWTNRIFIINIRRDEIANQAEEMKAAAGKIVDDKGDHATTFFSNYYFYC